MKKRKKDNWTMPNEAVSFKELVESRKQEMSGCLPGFTSRVKLDGKEAVVSSPKTFERGLFKVGEFEN